MATRRQFCSCAMSIQIEKLDMLVANHTPNWCFEVIYGSLRWLPNTPAKIRLSAEKGVIFLRIIS